MWGPTYNIFLWIILTFTEFLSSKSTDNIYKTTNTDEVVAQVSFVHLFLSYSRVFVIAALSLFLKIKNNMKSFYLTIFNSFILIHTLFVLWFHFISNFREALKDFTWWKYQKLKNKKITGISSNVCQIFRLADADRFHPRFGVHNVWQFLEHRHPMSW